MKTWMAVQRLLDCSKKRTRVMRFVYYFTLCRVAPGLRTPSSGVVKGRWEHENLDERMAVQRLQLSVCCNDDELILLQNARIFATKKNSCLVLVLWRTLQLQKNQKQKHDICREVSTWKRFAPRCR